VYLTDAQCGPNAVGLITISAAQQNPGRITHRMFRIAEEDHVEPGAPETPCPKTRQAGSIAAVQDLDDDPVMAGGNRVGVALHPVASEGAGNEV